MNEQLKLVVAEDNDTDAALIARHLARGGIKCTMRRVQTEFDFVDAIKDLKPDVIISDSNLITFDGMTALEMARKKFPDVLFIFCCGFFSDAILKEAAEKKIPCVLKNKDYIGLTRTIQESIGRTV